MLCSKCGANIPDGEKFCNACGTPVESIGAVTASTEETSALASTKKKGKGKIIAIIAIALVILSALAVGGYFLAKSLNSKKDLKEKAKEIESPYGAIQKLCDEAIELDYDGIRENLAFNIDLDELFQLAIGDNAEIRNELKSQYGTDSLEKILKDETDNSRDEMKAELEKEYGKNVKITVKVKDEKEMSDSEIQEQFDGIEQVKSYLNSYRDIAKQYAYYSDSHDGYDYSEAALVNNIDINGIFDAVMPKIEDIEEMCHITCDITIGGSKNSDIEEDLEVICVKIGGKWKVFGIDFASIKEEIDKLPDISNYSDFSNLTNLYDDSDAIDYSDYVDYPSYSEDSAV